MRNVVPKEGPRAPLFYSAITLLLSVNLAHAQTVDIATLEVCAALETEALKLACFEAIISKGIIAVTEVPTVETEVLQDDPATAIEAEVMLTSEVPVSIEAAPRDAKTSLTADVVPITTKRPVADDLGREQLAARDEEEQSEVIKATVVDVTQAYNKNLRFHLANGQVWRQIEPRHLQYPKNRDFEIKITRGMLGAYRMRIGENGRLVKIRRTQ